MSRWITSTLCSRLRLFTEAEESIRKAEVYRVWQDAENHHIDSSHHFFLLQQPLLTDPCIFSGRSRTTLQYQWTTTHHVTMCLPGDMLSSLPMAFIHTLPLTPGGKPSHHRSRTLRVPLLLEKLMYWGRVQNLLGLLTLRFYPPTIT